MSERQKVGGKNQGDNRPQQGETMALRQNTENDEDRDKMQR